jgi:hypothetical protein
LRKKSKVLGFEVWVLGKSIRFLGLRLGFREKSKVLGFEVWGLGKSLRFLGLKPGV